MLVVQNLIEKAYVEAKKDVELPLCKIVFNKENVTAEIGSDIYELERTTSALLEARTQWAWYYWEKEKNCFCKFSEQKIQQLEAAFLTGKSSVTYMRTAVRRQVTFADFQEQNLLTKSRIPLIRRPCYDWEEVKHTCAPRKWTSGGTLPEYWDPQEVPKEEFDFKCVEVPHASDEFKDLNDSFLLTMQDKYILHIYRVQNPGLWKRYRSRCMEMEQAQGASPQVLESKLYHGTTQTKLCSILKNGLDCRLAGEHSGARLGHGSYFSTSARLAGSYQPLNEENKYLLVCRVLTGHYEEGRENFFRPPAKDPSTPDNLYDSCVDNKANPTIFVIFDKDQSYPNYVIRYATSSTTLELSSSFELPKVETPSLKECLADTLKIKEFDLGLAEEPNLSFLDAHSATPTKRSVDSQSSKPSLTSFEQSLRDFKSSAMRSSQVKSLPNISNNSSKPFKRPRCPPPPPPFEQKLNLKQSDSPLSSQGKSASLVSAAQTVHPNLLKFFFKQDPIQPQSCVSWSSSTTMPTSGTPANLDNDELNHLATGMSSRHIDSAVGEVGSILGNPLEISTRSSSPTFFDKLEKFDSSEESCQQRNLSKDATTGPSLRPCVKCWSFPSLNKSDSDLNYNSLSFP